MWKGNSAIRPSNEDASERNLSQRKVQRKVQQEQDAKYTNRHIQEVKQLHIPDYNDDPVTTAWMSQPWHDRYRQQVPPWPFHVYVLRRAEAVLAAQDFPSRFVTWLHELGFMASKDGCDPHFEFYGRAFTNSISCMDHHRREVQHRNRNGLFPRLPPSCHERRGDLGYRGFVLIIDSEAWQDAGLLYAEFDREQFDRDSNWHCVYPGLECVARAVRVDHSTLIHILSCTFNDAGGKWQQEDLARKNDGGFSPALYPAMDPVANQDADAALPIIDMGSSPFDTYQPERLADSEDPSCAPGQMQFNVQKLWASPDASPHIHSRVYEDTLGWQTESVWDSCVSDSRPNFTFTLYLAASVPPFHATALFNCVNRDLLAAAPWTLDVVRNLPDLASALHHHDHEASRRLPERTGLPSPVTACMRMILRKIAGHVLPAELVSLIEEQCCPPDYVDFSCIPTRPFEHVFLYLNGSMQQAGPQVVYSRRVGSTFKLREDESNLPQTHRFICDDDRDCQLYISYMQFFRLVTDELHTIWSLCGPRYDLSAELMPRITMIHHFPQQSKPGGLEASVLPWEFSLILEGTKPVMLHHRGLDLLFHNQIKISEATSSAKEEPPCSVQLRFETLRAPKDMRTQSWSTLRTIRSSRHPSDSTGCTLYPNRTKKFESDPYSDDVDNGAKGSAGMLIWWRVQCKSFEGGKSYRIRFPDRMCLDRWTFGTVDNREGPYNLPPVEVTVEGEREFIIAIPRWEEEDDQDEEEEEEEQF